MRLTAVGTGARRRALLVLVSAAALGFLWALGDDGLHPWRFQLVRLAIQRPGHGDAHGGSAISQPSLIITSPAQHAGFGHRVVGAWSVLVHQRYGSDTR